MASFTAAEVALHNTRASFWTVCHGRVYDLTHYLALHPGGFRLLFQHAGGDATADFDALRHSKRAVAVLDSYWIGDLQGTKPHRSAPAGLGSAVRGAGGMLGDGLKAGAGVDGSRKPLVQGLSAAEVIKMQKVRPAQPHCCHCAHHTVTLGFVLTVDLSALCCVRTARAASAAVAV